MISPNKKAHILRVLQEAQLLGSEAVIELSRVREKLHKANEEQQRCSEARLMKRRTLLAQNDASFVSDFIGGGG